MNGPKDRRSYVWLLSLLLNISTAYANVIKLAIPGGEVRDIIYADANTAYAATQGGGIYRSLDGGSNWARLPNSPDRYVNQLAKGSAGTLYAATNGGVFLSMDSGGSWTRIFNDATTAIAVQPGTDNSLLWGAPGAGVYRMVGGSAPVLSSAGLANTGISSIAFDPAVVSTAYVGVSSPCNGGACLPESGTGVYRSTDGGINWSDITGNLGLKFVTGVAVTGDRTLFASTRRPDGCGLGGIHRLVSGSSNWINPADEADGMIYGAETVKVDQFDGASVWAGSCGLGLYRGVKSGSNWSFARQHTVGGGSSELLNASYAVGSASSSARVSVGVRGAGIFVSSNGRNGALTAWSEAVGLHALRATSFDISPIDAGVQYVGSMGAGVLRSTDYGTNWLRFNAGFPGLSGTSVPALLNVRALAAHPADLNKVAIVAGGFGGFPGGLFQANLGVWTQPAGGGTFLNPLGLIYVSSDDSVLVSNFDAQLQAGVFLGSASAGGWSQRIAGAGGGKLLQSHFIAHKSFLMMFASDDSAVASDGLGAVSTNGGSSWTYMGAAHTGFMRLGAYTLAERDGNYLVSSTNKGLFVSTDGGGSWTRVAIAGSPTIVFSGLAYYGSTLFTVSRSGGFYCSNNNGVSWANLSGLLPETPVFLDIKAVGGSLYLISDGAGIFSADPVCP
ncbi:MAG: hypothetical protein PHT19_07395 [Methylococcus sp.]|nr:hypothetical protein [Methylococcus sp.]